MAGRILREFDKLLEHYIVSCVLLAQFILTLIGVGDVRLVSLLGLLLCVVGLAQRSAQVDFWVLVPLVVYELASMASSWRVYRTIAEGYGALQLVFPVRYLLITCMDELELRLLKRLCTLWAGLTAALGVGQFVWQAAVRGQAARLGGLLGNPNALGIFLVAGWFLLLSCRREEDSPLLARLEPVLFMALALTLSMGSFVALAAGMLLLVLANRGAFFPCACRLLARASLGVGTGVLMYLASARTGLPWSCILLLLYGGLLTAWWPDFEHFLQAKPKLAAVISLCGGVVAMVVVAIRPSSIATFAERLEMMVSGTRYLTANPLLGVGPFQWRQLDFSDGGTYFNTWHIHNAPLHVGVELGWIALVMLIIPAVRFFQKRREAEERAGFAAFCVHSMMDTGFFYLGITSLVLIGASGPGEKRLSGGGLKALFGAFALVFAWNLLQSVGG